MREMGNSIFTGKILYDKYLVQLDRRKANALPKPTLFNPQTRTCFFIFISMSLFKQKHSIAWQIYAGITKKRQC